MMKLFAARLQRNVCILANTNIVVSSFAMFNIYIAWILVQETMILNFQCYRNEDCFPLASAL